MNMLWGALLLFLLLKILDVTVSTKKKGGKKKNKPLQVIHAPEEITWKWDPQVQKYVPYRNGVACGQDEAVPELPEELSEESETIDYEKAYQARYLLTKNEWHAFKKLQKAAAEKDFMICPKVRLLDIIEPIKGHEKYMTLFSKVRSKHVDFVICDQNAHIKAILELDDSSHDREDRKERDQFVDKILKSVGYSVIHVRDVAPDIFDQLS